MTERTEPQPSDRLFEGECCCLCGATEWSAEMPGRELGRLGDGLSCKLDNPDARYCCACVMPWTSRYDLDAEITRRRSLKPREARFYGKQPPDEELPLTLGPYAKARNGNSRAHYMLTRSHRFAENGIAYVSPPYSWERPSDIDWTSVPLPAPEQVPSDVAEKWVPKVGDRVRVRVNATLRITNACAECAGLKAAAPGQTQPEAKDPYAEHRRRIDELVGGEANVGAATLKEETSAPRCPHCGASNLNRWRDQCGACGVTGKLLAIGAPPTDLDRLAARRARHVSALGEELKRPCAPRHPADYDADDAPECFSTEGWSGR